MQAFIVELDGFMQQFKAYLTPSNYDRFISQTTIEVTSQMEKAVFKVAFNRVRDLTINFIHLSCIGSM